MSEPTWRRAADRASTGCCRSQVLDLKGDWAVQAAACPPGRLGLPVQQCLLSRSRRHRGRGDGNGPRAARNPKSRSREYDEAISRGREWIEGMQSRDGGWAAFDVDNLEYYLNNIPFSDHGALLDPPTEDVTARCVSMLAQLGETAQTSKAVADGIAYLRRTQLAEGSLVRPLGPELYLWNLVGAVRAQCGRRQPPGPDDPQGGGLARLDPEPRRRLGRGCGQLPDRLPGIRGGTQPPPRKRHGPCLD